MDTTKGELSFAVSGVNFGVAYEGISQDKPLVPCVLLCYEDDSVELDTTEVKEIRTKEVHVCACYNRIEASFRWFNKAQ